MPLPAPGSGCPSTGLVGSWAEGCPQPGRPFPGDPSLSLAPHLSAADGPWPGCVNPLAHSETAHIWPPSPNDCLGSAVARKDCFIYVRNTESPGQHWGQETLPAASNEQRGWEGEGSGPVLLVGFILFTYLFSVCRSPQVGVFTSKISVLEPKLKGSYWLFSNAPPTPSLLAFLAHWALGPLTGCEAVCSSSCTLGSKIHYSHTDNPETWFPPQTPS